MCNGQYAWWVLTYTPLWNRFNLPFLGLVRLTGGFLKATHLVSILRVLMCMYGSVSLAASEKTIFRSFLIGMQNLITLSTHTHSGKKNPSHLAFYSKRPLSLLNYENAQLSSLSTHHKLCKYTVVTYNRLSLVMNSKLFIGQYIGLTVNHRFHQPWHKVLLE